MFIGESANVVTDLQLQLEEMFIPAGSLGAEISTLPPALRFEAICIQKVVEAQQCRI